MTFQRIGQDWQAKRLFGAEAGEHVLIRSGSWCWVEERADESLLGLDVGDCAVIEDATQLVDGDGAEVPGGLERAARWETLAKRHKLEIPQHFKAKRSRRRIRTKAKEARDG